MISTTSPLVAVASTRPFTAHAPWGKRSIISLVPRPGHRLKAWHKTWHLWDQCRCSFTLSHTLWRRLQGINPVSGQLFKKYYAITMYRHLTLMALFESCMYREQKYWSRNRCRWRVISYNIKQIDGLFAKRLENTTAEEQLHWSLPVWLPYMVRCRNALCQG